MTSILIVDDEDGARLPICEFLEDEGFDVRGASDGVAALAHCDGWTPDVVVTDLRMPNMDGLALIDALGERAPDTSIVVMTAFGSVETAVEALRRGANDYLVKPIHLGQLLVMMHRIRRQRDLKAQLREVESRGDAAGGDNARVMANSTSPSMRSLHDSIGALAGANTHVLLYGEIGVGKSNVGRMLHAKMARNSPLRVLNCAFQADKVVRRMLFGSEEEGRPGWLHDPDAVVMLVDVEHMSAPIQEALQSHLAGGPGISATSMATIISTTSVDLHEEVDAGRFLPALYRMLAVARVRVPTLRERGDDVVALITAQVERSAARYERAVPTISGEALTMLVEYGWQGNLRQLRQVMDRAVLMCVGDTITPRELPDDFQPSRDDAGPPRVPGASLRELERFALLRTLESVGGSTTKAANVLGISPRKIQYRLNEYRAEELERRQGNDLVE